MGGLGGDELEPDQQAAPAHSAQSGADRGAQARLPAVAELRRASRELVALGDGERREAGGAQQRVTAERGHVRERRVVRKRLHDLGLREKRAKRQSTAECLCQYEDVWTDGQCWHANHVPVRPRPVMTSSQMSKAPVVSQRARSAGKK